MPPSCKLWGWNNMLQMRPSIKAAWSQSKSSTGRNPVKRRQIAVLVAWKVRSRVYVVPESTG